MKPSAQGYRVAVVGASSLLGKEILAVLEERSFPVSRLVTFEADEEEPDLPIVDLREHSQTVVTNEDVSEQELDLAFLADRPQPTSALPRFLKGVLGEPGVRGSGDGATQASVPRASPCVVIDLCETLAAVTDKVLTVPFLERGTRGKSAERATGGGKLFVSAHPGTILISSLLLRLVARFSVKRAVAQVFMPASELGSRAVEELQKQTVNLLSFQKIPHAVFGAQLAFNMLPRLGRGRRTDPGDLDELEKRLRWQLRDCLGERAPVPALCLFQTPVFYSLAVSLYVETGEPADPGAVAKALAGEPLRVRRATEQAPSQVEVTGSGEVLVDAISADPDHPRGVWIWAVADNIRLAAVNAVEIAETLVGQVRSKTTQ